MDKLLSDLQPGDIFTWNNIRFAYVAPYDSVRVIIEQVSEDKNDITWPLHRSESTRRIVESINYQPKGMNLYSVIENTTVCLDIPPQEGGIEYLFPDVRLL